MKHLIRKSSLIYLINSNISHQFLRVPMLFMAVFLLAVRTSQAQTIADANLILVNSSASFTVELSDTSNIAEFEIQIGSRNGFDDIFSNVYSFDQSTGLNPGLSYERNQNKVTLGLGEIAIVPNYFSRIRLKSSSVWGDWFNFVSN